VAGRNRGRAGFVPDIVAFGQGKRGFLYELEKMEGKIWQKSLGISLHAHLFSMVPYVGAHGKGSLLSD
jgi:hypothetical protein